MKNYIVCTTINGPTEALKKFAAMRDWGLIIVADKKTPDEEWFYYLRDSDIQDVIYFNCKINYFF